MTVTTMTAARRLCARSGWKLNNSTLQRLLYLAHMVHLGRYGTPLIDGEFQASLFGPIEHDLYRRLCRFGTRPVREFGFNAPEITASSAAAQCLDETLARFWPAPLGALVAATQIEDGAWARHYSGSRGAPGGSRPAGPAIPNLSILREYQRRTAQDAAA